MHTLIEQHRADIAALCHRYGVRQLAVFGSAARGTDFDPATGDADFRVTFTAEANHDLAEFANFKDALEALLSRPGRSGRSRGGRGKPQYHPPLHSE
jgi:predicted nucleotidyltransferase